MTSRFEPDGAPGEDPIMLRCSELIPGESPAPRFVIEEPDGEDPPASCDDSSHGPLPDTNPQPPVQSPLIASGPDLSWRSEVAARLDRYRARRRPRAPRYPSLTLKFDSPEPRPAPRFPATNLISPPTRQALAMDSAAVTEASVPSTPAVPGPVFAMPAETGKLLEFPRPVTLPARPLDELADPVLDRPRILEAPEVAPPPPALGGILMEAAAPRVEEKRPGFEIPLQAARMSRRLAAALVDGFLVLFALALFAWLFFRITRIVPPLLPAAEMSLMLAGIFWGSYQFLLLIFTGTTPGLKLARLQLSRFDGTPVPRRLRRWRLLASVLSAASLGLGYAWCFLDEDQLCWHDRITRTYMAPKP